MNKLRETVCYFREKFYGKYWYYAVMPGSGLNTWVHDEHGIHREHFKDEPETFAELEQISEEEARRKDPELFSTCLDLVQTNMPYPDENGMTMLEWYEYRYMVEKALEERTKEDRPED